MATEMGSELWVKKLLKELQDISEENTVQWCTIMHKIGLNENTKQEWISIFKEQIIDLYSDMINDAKKVQNTLIESIEDLLMKSKELCTELRIKMPNYGSQELGLVDEKKLLQTNVDEYEAIIKSKKREIQRMVSRQAEVCRCLGVKPKILPDSPFPSEEELLDFQEHIESLEGEKFKREERFFKLKCEIVDIINELGIEPSLEMEKIVISPDDSLFMVTESNMNWVESYYQSLIAQRDQIKQDISDIRGQVRSLWEMLSEDLKFCNEFMQKHTGNSLVTLEALSMELKRCKDLKKANIEKFVKSLREEISSLWTQCHFTEIQRSEFEYFNNSLYTEDLLTLHDLEINKLKKYYEDNSELFTLLEKREKLLSKMLELEERATAPDRLKNRGGRLLREEKERNKLSKDLPVIEAHLLQLADDFELRTGRMFLSRGKTIREIIEKFHVDYEMKKLQKSSARKHQKEVTLTPSKSNLFLGPMSSSRKNLAPSATGRKSPGMTSVQKNFSTHTPMSAIKRKPGIQLFSDSKRMKTEVQPKGSHLPAKKLQLDSRTIVTRSRYSIERYKRLKKIRQFTTPVENKEKNTRVTEEYNDFEKKIQVGCRSTIFMDSSSSLAVPLPLTPKAGSSIRTPLKKFGRTPTKSKLKPISALQLDI